MTRNRKTHILHEDTLLRSTYVTFDVKRCSTRIAWEPGIFVRITVISISIKYKAFGSDKGGKFSC